MLAVAVIGALTFVLSALSVKLQRTGVPPLLIALACGALLGPFAAGVVQPTAWGLGSTEVLESVARVVLAVSLLGVALRFPRGYWRANLRWIVASIAVGMVVMFAVATGAVLLLGIPLLSAMLIAAAITPTDPVVTTPIVTGTVAEERIPKRVRLNLSSESGLNDGLAYLILMLPVLLVTTGGAEAWREWLTTTLLWEVAVPVVVGFGLGWAAGWLLDTVIARGWSNSTSYLGYALALALAILAGLRVIETDAVLGVFVAGAAFGNRLTDDLRAELGREIDELGRVLILPLFAVIGALLPFDRWAAEGWALPIVLVLALIARRIAGMWLTRPIYARLHSRTETAFMSWFGPVGVSALLYACLAERRTGDDLVLPAVLLAIALSVVIHGLSTRPAGEWLRRRERMG